MTDQTDFKIFFKKAGYEEVNNVEIRRFALSSGRSGDYNDLVAKLQEIFPELKGQRFTVSWKDNDGDDVVISSSEELVIALQEPRYSPVCKLYVVAQQEGKRETFQSQRFNLGASNTSKVHHSGVVCDGCDTDIYGFRYKCLQCPDYDLCHECEAKSLHPEHCMLRLSVPKQWKSHYGRRLTHHLNRFMKRATTVTEEEPEECPFKPSKRRSSFGGNSPHGRRCGDQSSWLDILSTYLNDWANLPNECPINKEGATAATAAPKSEKPDKKPASSAPGVSTSQDSSKPTVQQPFSSSQRSSERSSQDNHVEFLKNIGENIAQFLDPFGIDVSVAVKPDGFKDQAAKSQAPKTTQPRASDELLGAAAAATAPTAPKPEQAATQIGFKANVQPTRVPDADVKSQKSSSPDSDEWTFINNDSSTTTTSASTSSPSTPGNTPETPKPATSVAKENKPPTPTASANMYPSLDSSNGSNVFHPNPKVQRAVEAMMQMGFSNEGGWLTQLLARKDGDISKVLDLLQPAKATEN